MSATTAQENEPTITVPEAVELMRQVSRVTADQLRERDGLGRWARFPEIRRYQVSKGVPGKRGSAITVERVDVMKWIAAQQRQGKEQSEPLQAVTASPLHTYADLFPRFAQMGAHSLIRSLSRNKRTRKTRAD